MRIKAVSQLSVYREICQMVKEIDRPLRHMSRDYKYDVGKEIRGYLRKLKYLVSEINMTEVEKREPLFNKFGMILTYLKIAIDECIDLDILKTKGKDTIYAALCRMKEIERQITKWRNYCKDRIPVANAPLTENEKTMMRIATQVARQKQEEK